MGQLKKVTDHTGRSVLLQYEEEKLKKVITASGAEYVYRYEEVKDWLGTTKIAMDEAGCIASVTDPYGKPWDMNGEAWARERQFFIQMEKRPYMNTMKPCS